MEILIIGNGFDIAHGLPTSYSDFYTFLNNEKKNEFLIKLNDVEYYTTANQNDSNGLYDRFQSTMEHVDKAKINEMCNILKQNVWAKYYALCGQKIENWIDFEKEMFPVIEILNQLFSNSVGTTGNNTAGRVEAKFADKILFNKATILDKYFTCYDGSGTLIVKPNYGGINYGVYENEILKDIKKELEIFIDMFRTYLKEIVDKIEIHKIPMIENIKADATISFNYTTTEKYYDNINKLKIYHIHGDINETSNDVKCNMVMGVNAVNDDENNKFIFFTKFFQRIQKRTDMRYKELLKPTRPDQQIEKLSIYGHSLDKTDEDVIKPFLEAAQSIDIYHYGQADYERKIINLINMLGKDKVENYVYSGRIRMIDTTA